MDGMTHDLEHDIDPENIDLPGVTFTAVRAEDVPQPPEDYDFDHEDGDEDDEELDFPSGPLTASSTPASRGWGQPAAEDRDIVKVTTRGITLYVDRRIAVIVAHLARDLDYYSSRLKKPLLNKTKDDWGYAYRKVRGSSRWSNHAWGLAVDFNATLNPMTDDGRVVTQWKPKDIRQLMATRYHGLVRWGGSYTGSRKDAMHFEFMGTPRDAAALTRALLAEDKKKGWTA